MPLARPRRNTIVIGLLAGLGLLILLGGVWGVFRSRSPEPISVRQEFQDSPRSHRDERFVGSDVCRQCHAGHGDRWVQSAHNLALADIDLAAEPPDGEFAHPASGRNYRILRRDGQFWHQEWLPTTTEPLLLAEHPMRAVIGSGHFSRSYLWCDGEFWMESPATWYAARQEWGISPGYDVFNHGFERPIDLRCIRCHAGQVEAIDASVHRLDVQVASVDCERCHGPGDRHVALRQRGNAKDPVEEFIVHPAKLSRELQIDLCAQCHLHGDATVELAGGGVADFQPGQPLSQFQVHFALDFGSREMAVVGHVEQMKLSRCYTESQTLTCTTCHDPHGRLPTDAAVDHRASCLTCHSEQSCSIEPAVRRQQQPADDCAECHMPRVPTEIPHFAFRHHRIGRHTGDAVAPPAKSSSSPGRLVPLDDLSHLTAAQRDRVFGLAGVQLLTHSSARDHGAAYAALAQEHLERAAAAGAGDAEVQAALARLLWPTDPERAKALAEQALASAGASADVRSAALFALARSAGQRDIVSAIPYWEQLVKLRRYGDAWHALGRGYRVQGRLSEAIAAVQKAVEISPERPDFRRTLAGCLSTAGDEAAAKRNLEWAARLEGRR